MNNMKSYNPERVVAVVELIVAVTMLCKATVVIKQVIFDFTFTTF